MLDAVEQLQGAPLPASLLETEILPARVEGYLPGDLDALAAGGEVSWVGLEPLGERDGRVALYLTDALPALVPPAARDGGEAPAGERARRILEHLARRGASFFADVHEAAGGGYPQATVDALWTLVWKGLVTNDTFQALRAYTSGERPARAGAPGRPPGAAAPGTARAWRRRPRAGGRWTLVAARRDAGGRPRPTPTHGAPRSPSSCWSATAWSPAGWPRPSRCPAASARSTTCSATSRSPGGSAAGYFVGGVGAMQFALPGALDLLRASREPPEVPEVVTLAATDPANPWGALLEWPPLAEAPEGKRPARAVGAVVVLVDGEPAAWAPRGLRQLLAWLPELEPERSRTGAAAAAALAALAAEARGRGTRACWSRR